MGFGACACACAYVSITVIVKPCVHCHVNSNVFMIENHHFMGFYFIIHFAFVPPHPLDIWTGIAILQAIPDSEW